MDRREFLKALPIGIWGIKECFANGINDIVNSTIAEKNNASEPDSNKDSSLNHNYSVLIHPGHVKGNPGCELKGVGIEYILTTRIAEDLEKLLKEQNIGVLMARNENDFSLELKKYKQENRGKFLGRKIDTYTMLKWAEDKGADALISIHINDVPPENRPFNTGYAVISSSKNGSLKKSRQLAKMVHESIGQSFPPSNNLNEASYVKQDGAPVLLSGFMNSPFYILGSDEYSHKIPAIIVECGFISQKYKGSNGQELTIGNPEIQQLYAQRIAKGIMDYIAEDRKSRFKEKTRP